MDNKNKIPLFRSEALAQLNVSSQLNQRLRITSKFSWVVMLAVGIILIAIVIWGFIGSIPTRVQGDGILLATKGSLYNAVAPEGNGRIISIVAKPGDLVTKNQVIAYLETPDLEEKITVAKSYLASLQTEYQDLMKQSKKEIQDNAQQIEAQNKILQKTIESETENLKSITELLATKNAAYKKGLIAQQEVAITLQNFYDTKKGINQAASNLEDNKIKQASFVTQWQDRLNSLELKVKEQQYQVDDLQVKLSSSNEVKSPINGIVTYIQTSIGDKVEGGQVVATIATAAKDLDAVIYVPAKDGKRVKTGMTVLISPTTIKKEEFGSIKAEVVQVSPFPSTPKSMLAVLQNDDLVKEFSKEGATIAVRVHLKTDKKTYSGYEWTSSQGPEQTISSGTLVKAWITVRTQKPVTLIIPALKKLLGE